MPHCLRTDITRLLRSHSLTNLLCSIHSLSVSLSRSLSPHLFLSPLFLFTARTIHAAQLLVQCYQAQHKHDEALGFSHTIVQVR